MSLAIGRVTIETVNYLSRSLRQSTDPIFLVMPEL